MIRIVLVCILVLFSSIAWSHPYEGGLTPEETASVMKAREAWNATLDLTIQYCDLAGNSADCKELAEAAYAFGQTIGYLLGVNVHNNVGEGWTVLSNRATAVQWAGFRKDWAIVNLNRAVSFHVTPKWQEAFAAAQQIDLSLPYLTPFPVFHDNPLGVNEQNQFGPHGEYEQAQLSLWDLIRYAGPGTAGAMQAWMDALAAGEVNETSVVSPLAESAKRSMLVILMSAHVIHDSQFSSFPSYRTDAEEALPNVARHPLTEIALAMGGGDNVTQRNSAPNFRLFTAIKNAGAAVHSPGVNFARFCQQFGDGWGRFDRWPWRFNVIR